MSIEINQINKSFGRTPVLNDISLDIPSGQMVALLGPSGPSVISSSAAQRLRSSPKRLPTMAATGASAANSISGMKLKKPAAAALRPKA